jgi:prepilin-type N-terminal cleavage/methylation domain-containing protein/prepilin-type processing-associated H-X9-DG protein
MSSIRSITSSRQQRAAFTLIELLVVIAIISVLASLLFPVFFSAREHAREAACESNLRQIGLAMYLYQQDYDELFPSRRDLKATPCPPWASVTSYPASDPRCGWATVVLDPYVTSNAIWSCPSIAGTSIGNAQEVLEVDNGVSSRYWMWGFDHNASIPMPIDDFWGKTDEQSIAGQHAAYLVSIASHTSYPKGDATSTADCELATDPYFPNTRNVLPSQRGLAVHFGGRNRLYLDGHVKWYRDARLSD